MSLGQKVIRKTDALARKVKSLVTDYEKINMQEEVLNRAVGSKQQVLSTQRRQDSEFGMDVTSQKIKLAELATAVHMTRHDFGAGDFALRLELAASNAVTFEVAEVTDITCPADVAGSLNNKYFFLNSAKNATQYYVWFNINSAGTDPALAGFTAIRINAATDASANTIATAMRSGIAAANTGNDFATSGSTSHCIVTNLATGNTTNASDHNSGATFSVTTQGVTYSNKLGLKSGDLIQVLAGTYKDKTFQVVSTTDHFCRLDFDAAGYSTENNLPIRVLESTVKPSFT